MMLARWQVDARFGHKQAVIDKVAAWCNDIAPELGWAASVRTKTMLRTYVDASLLGPGQLVASSVGAREPTIAHEWMVRDLCELESAWGTLARLDAQSTWSRDLARHVVPDTSRWEVYRIV